MNKNSPTVTVKSAYDALGAAGFPKSFVTRLLPDWWDNALFKTSTGAIEFASILKQRLGLDVGFAENGELQVLAPDRRARYKSGRQRWRASYRSAPTWALRWASWPSSV